MAEDWGTDPAELERARREMQRAEDSDPATGRHRVLAQRTWQDEYPDDLVVSVQVVSETGRAYTVVTGQAVWLSSEQVFEVRQFLGECVDLVEAYNGELRA